MAFDQAHQLPTESLLQWSSRIRLLFCRANPAQEQDCNANETLIRKFILGMVSSVIKGHTLEGAPATLAAALTRAQNKAACEAVVSGSVAGGTKITAMSAPAAELAVCTNPIAVAALTDGTATPSTTQATQALRQGNLFPNSGILKQFKCWGCGSPDHFLSSCNNPRGGPNAVGRGGGRGTWGRGRGRGRGKPTGRGGAGGSSGGARSGRGRGRAPRINAMSGPADVEMADGNDELANLAQSVEEEAMANP